MTEVVVDPTMIERIAKAIWMENQPAGAPAYDDLDFLDQGRVKMIARACIKAMREPTDEMVQLALTVDCPVCNYGGFYGGPDDDKKATGFYTKMIDAALKED